MLFLDIIDLYLGSRVSFGVPGCQAACFFEGTVRKFTVFGADDHMGTSHLLCMEPPVISGCKLESQLIILEIVFSHIDIKTVTGYVVERFGFRLGFLAFFVCVVTFDIAVLSELFLDLGKVTFRSGDIQSIGDRFQMRDLTFRICDLFCDGFLCTLQLSVFIKIFLGILCRSQCRVKRDSDLLVGVIVQCLKGSAAFLKPVSVGVDQFTVDLEFIFFCSIIQLLFLDVVFFFGYVPERSVLHGEDRRISGGCVSADFW